jgi:hypothetical protein
MGRMGRTAPRNRRIQAGDYEPVFAGGAIVSTPPTPAALRAAEKIVTDREGSK